MLSNVYVNIYTTPSYWINAINININVFSRRLSVWFFFLEKCGVILIINWGRVTNICVSKLTIIGSDDGLSPDKCWNIVDGSRRNALQWNLNRSSYIFIQYNASEHVVWTMAAILSRPQGVEGNKVSEMFTRWCRLLYHRSYLDNIVYIASGIKQYFFRTAPGGNHLSYMIAQHSLWYLYHQLDVTSFYFGCHLNGWYRSTMIWLMPVMIEIERGNIYPSETRVCIVS